MLENLYSDEKERFIVIKDYLTRSGYNILQDIKHDNLNRRFYLTPCPDIESGYIVFIQLHGERFEVFPVVTIFDNMHDASEWVHEHSEQRW